MDFLLWKRLTENLDWKKLNNFYRTLNLAKVENFENKPEIA